MCSSGRKSKIAWYSRFPTVDQRHCHGQETIAVVRAVLETITKYLSTNLTRYQNCLFHLICICNVILTFYVQFVGIYRPTPIYSNTFIDIRRFLKVISFSFPFLHCCSRLKCEIKNFKNKSCVEGRTCRQVCRETKNYES